MIHIQHLSKSFKGHQAVRDVSLEIQKGAYLALLGPNGAGKTTLVEMIEGLQQPDGGMISIKGMNWKNHRSQLRSLMGLSLQETRFVDKLTVKETLEMFASFYRLPGKRVGEIMEAVDLQAKASAYTLNLSGGQRQKLALGVAIMHEPELLLLDEPTTGLDPNSRRELWEILKRLRQTHNTTLILTTHYMEEAEYLCDRIVIMDQGKILADGSMDELLDEYEEGEIIEFELNKAVSEAQLSADIPGFRQFINQNERSLGQLVVDDITQALPNFLQLLEKQQIDLKKLECRKKTLDDLFVSMTGRRLHA